MGMAQSVKGDPDRKMITKTFDKIGESCSKGPWLIKPAIEFPAYERITVLTNAVTKKPLSLLQLVASQFRNGKRRQTYDSSLFAFWELEKGRLTFAFLGLLIDSDHAAI